ncbi:hypothetical protein WCW05_004098 [Escherichia coli]
MTELISSREDNENTPVSEIIRQKQQETRELLKAELARKRTPPLVPKLKKPEKFALDYFVEQYPRRLKSGKSRAPS